MAGDREKCIAAGMNGYVSKPIRPETLEQAIEQWTVSAERKGSAPSRGLDTSGVGTSGKPTTVNRLPVTAEFDGDDFVERLMGDEDMAQKILRGFVEEMPLQLARLARAVENSDGNELRLVAHSIKGAAANVGGNEVREVALKMEKSAASGDLSAAPAALLELSASFDRARPIMEEFCDGP
jgi:HPt (histidine-containing phosphotransfer) domain-containing protein